MTYPLALFALSNFCWAYMIVLAVIWFRAVRQRDMREHIGHFVSLMAAFIPGIWLAFLVLFLGAILNLLWLPPLVLVAFPGGVAAGLHFEVSQLTAPTAREEAMRMAATTLLAIGMTSAGPG